MITHVTTPSVSTMARPSTGEQKLAGAVGGSVTEPAHPLSVSAARDRSSPAETDKTAADSKGKDGSSLDQLRQAVDEANNFIKDLQRNLVFAIDESTNRVVVKVVDRESGEVVRQIPSDEVLNLVKRLKEYAEQPSPQGNASLLVKDRA